MVYLIEDGDICKANTDIIVNASNGVGNMGGKTGLLHKEKGVAEQLHFATRGTVEKEAKKHANYFKPIKAGNVFITSAGNLPVKYIIHAVTMKYPGCRAKLETIKELLPKIVNACNELNCQSISIPLLGTGTGRLNKAIVKNLIIESFEGLNLEIYLYV